MDAEGSEGGGEVPIGGIRPHTISILSTMLNPIKIIYAENGLPRDWRGLAELGGVSSEMMNFLQNKGDPTGELVKMWMKMGESKCQVFSDLRAFLAVIDRFDVVEDVGPLLDADAAVFKEAQGNRVEGQAGASFNPEIDRNILTIEDSQRLHQNLPLTRYDAFILYADEDSNFANQVIDKMEMEHGLKLCVKDRDLLPGIMFEHEVIGRLIEERCNRFLVIFSPNFLKSPANHFLVSFAQASALESRVRKIVPCVYEQCELPPSVRYCFSIKYNRSGRLFNFWDKLSQSLKTAPTTKATPDRLELINKLQDPLSDESFKWWDADKESSKSSTSTASTTPPPSYRKTLEMSKPISSQLNEVSEACDTFSLNSSSPLVSSSGKSKKWFKKWKNPIKSKKQAVAD